MTGKRGEPVPVKLDLLDAYFIRGLGLEREKNGTHADYHLFTDDEELVRIFSPPFDYQGLVIYTPNSLMNPDNFINPEKNKKMYEGQNQAVVRKLMCIQSPLTIKIFDKNDEEIALEESMNTWEHLVVFES